MSNNAFIRNSFRGGMNQDAHISSTPENTYTYALNLINKDHDQSSFVSNEHSNRQCGVIPDIVSNTAISTEVYSQSMQENFNSMLEFVISPGALS